MYKQRQIIIIWEVTLAFVSPAHQKDIYVKIADHDEGIMRVLVYGVYFVLLDFREES
jgi:hypothetical protein